jgi:hypothetical protein
MKAKQIALDEGMHWGDQVADTYFRKAETDIDRHWCEMLILYYANYLTM